MNAINSIYLSQLHHGETVTFHRDTLEQLEKADPAHLGVQEQVKEYDFACEELQLTIDVFSTNSLSKESLRRDNLRERAYSAFKAYIKVYLNDEDESKVEAAERIIAVIRQSEREIGNPRSIGMTKRTTALSSLLRNLEPLSDDIQQIGAENRLKRLAETNQAFIDLQFERYMEQSNKHSGDVKAACALANTIYKQIIERVNAKILLEGETAFLPYIKAQNTVIEKYKNLIAQRKGRNKIKN
ncbi:MAG: DUF6261 family protein [Bacteroidales bacterium]|jgi:hypothetical protein|nr:DUF6261 family protein [Bacteroidales bacterium]